MMDQKAIPQRQAATIWTRLAPALASALLLAACASTPPPTEQLAVATAALEQAISAGAQELAPAELRSARDKLNRAHAQVVAEDYVQARMLAEQSQADAQLAITKTRAAKAQKAAAALEEDSRVLREEINRKAP